MIVMLPAATPRGIIPGAGTGWGDNDPIANPGDLRELDGRAMTVSGAVVRGPADTDSNTNGRPGWLLLTNDGGAHWHRARL